MSSGSEPTQHAERAGRASRTILHVDMDSFYASVEMLLDASLVGKPVIVGGDGARGVVASCNYEARAYGVHSAMSSMQAKRLCPHAVFVHGRYDTYAEFSSRFHEIFRSYTPVVEGISLDEAFLDVTGATGLFGGGAQIAHDIRRRVWEELGLPCAVGVGPNKLLAKLASKAAKPTPSRKGTIPGKGVVVIETGSELEFLHPLPVRALWGVGPATQQRLERFGIRTVKDLAELPLDTLVGALGRVSGRHLHDLAWARDDRPVVAEAEAKSIGHEETYARDLHTFEACDLELVRMADAVAARLRKHDLAGRTITLKVRFHDFHTITRSHTLPTPTATARLIADVAKDLLRQVDPSPGVRLLGVTASNLGKPVAEQLTLDETMRPAAADRAAEAIEEVRRKFGDAAVGPAALVGRSGLRVKRQGDTQWGPSTEPPRSESSDGGSGRE
ncbi:MAG TPA: DNA polymerase IV [Acidimicrobiales bacterium]|nr:DNA polymerase IV [Acidimicrobiales bacterium]